MSTDAPRRPGRPTTGRPTPIRFPDDQRARIEQWAAERNLTYAEAVRQLCDAGLLADR